MSGHTPGPWTLTHVDGNNFAIQRFEIRGMLGDSLNVYPIFNRNLGPIDCASVYTSPEDAALISAAPDLLEALEGLLDGLPFVPTANEYELVQAGCDPTEARRLAAAFAAIAKAKGGEA